MRERYLSFITWAHTNLDDIQVITSFPTIWSLVTTLFFIDTKKSPFIVNQYPILFYGLIFLIMTLLVFSIVSNNILARRGFFLILVFGGIYSAINTYQFAHELNITVGLFFYLALNAAYGFVRIGFQKKKVTEHV